jgi:hypothetical protein
MARFKLDVDVETTEILVGGVWLTIDEANELVDRLMDILDAHGWSK